MARLHARLLASLADGFLVSLLLRKITPDHFPTTDIAGP